LRCYDSAYSADFRCKRLEEVFCYKEEARGVNVSKTNKVHKINKIRAAKERLRASTKASTKANTKPKKRKIKKYRKYPKAKCIVDGCKNNAVGKGDVCKRHGGDPIIEENLLVPEEIPSAMVSAKYKPEYHPIAFIQMSKTGMSDVEIAAEFEVSVGTIRKWSETYLEFNTAYEVGQALHEAWWLQEGKNNLDNRGYNTTLFKFLTGNKLGYSDKMESKNLNVTAGVLMVPGKMDINEWEEKVERKKGS
jgi:DNA-binding transcriptional regulator YiaG